MHVLRILKGQKRNITSETFVTSATTFTFLAFNETFEARTELVLAISRKVTVFIYVSFSDIDFV